MKCIHCGTDNKLRDRVAHGGQCRQCGHPFAFEPTQDAWRLSDSWFAGVLSDVSANNTLYFTAAQFHHAIDKKLYRRQAIRFPGGVPGGLALSAFAILGILLLTQAGHLNRQSILELILALPVCFGLFVAAIAFDSPQQQPTAFTLSEEQNNLWLQRWQAVNPIPTLLPAEPTASFATPVASAADADAGEYSFDRLLVCDRVDTVRFLIANRFHFEYNCAVLSIDGYPERIFDTVMVMVRRNPELQVYSLHDCSPQGIAVPYRLQTETRWFADTQIAIVDLGLSPRQVLAGKNFFVQTAVASGQEALLLSPDLRATLSAADYQFLASGKHVSLDSLKPQRLMQIAALGVTRPKMKESSIFAAGDREILIHSYESFG